MKNAIINTLVFIAGVMALPTCESVYYKLHKRAYNKGHDEGYREGWDNGYECAERKYRKEVNED